jgi:hypothetical protein
VFNWSASVSHAHADTQWVFFCRAVTYTSWHSNHLDTSTAMGSLVCLPRHKRAASAPPQRAAEDASDRPKRRFEWTPTHSQPISISEPTPALVGEGNSTPFCACSPPPEIRLYWGDYWPPGGERSPRYVGGSSDVELDVISSSDLSSLVSDTSSSTSDASMRSSADVFYSPAESPEWDCTPGSCV